MGENRRRPDPGITILSENAAERAADEQKLLSNAQSPAALALAVEGLVSRQAEGIQAERDALASERLALADERRAILEERRSFLEERRALQLERDALAAAHGELASERAALGAGLSAERAAHLKEAHQLHSQIVAEARESARKIEADAAEAAREARKEAREAHLQIAEARAAVQRLYADAERKLTAEAEKGVAQIKLMEESQISTLNFVSRARQLAEAVTAPAKPPKSGAEVLGEVVDGVLAFASQTTQTLLSANPQRSGELVGAITNLVQKVSGASEAPPSLASPEPGDAGSPPVVTDTPQPETQKAPSQPRRATVADIARAAEAGRASELINALAAQRGCDPGDIPIDDVIDQLDREQTTSQGSADA